ncbi:hypothetical protein GBA52_024409 [Prunus armeniaca]|nr:hypothetical protein GBA52_024409 [Prunus armeniaca]
MDSMSDLLDNSRATLCVHTRCLMKVSCGLALRFAAHCPAVTRTQDHPPPLPFIQLHSTSPNPFIPKLITHNPRCPNLHHYLFASADHHRLVPLPFF